MSGGLRIIVGITKTLLLKGVLILNSRTCKSVFVYDPGRFWLQIELGLLINRQGHYPGLSTQGQGKHKDSCKWKREATKKKTHD
jgi:hypothetical protein